MMKRNQINAKTDPVSNSPQSKMTELWWELSEHDQATVSGGAREEFERTKDHVNIGTIGVQKSDAYAGEIVLLNYIMNNLS